MPVAAVTTSAAGSLNLLEDEDKEIRGYALNHLLTIVPQFWAEISEKISWLEVLADSDSQELPSAHQPYAALLLSKLYHYIGQDEEAVEFALRAGSAFEKEVQGEYRDTIIAGCLDMAIKQTKQGKELDASLSAIVEAVLRAGTTDHGKLAIGLALSLRRLDLVETFYIASRAPVDSSSSAASTSVQHDESMLRYVLGEAISGTSGNENWPADFRADLFKILLRLFQRSPVPDWSSMTIIWVQSRAVGPTVEALTKLCNAKDNAQAYQIVFDLYEIAPQVFITEIRQGLVNAGLGPDQSLEASNVRNVIEKVLSGEETAKLFLNFMSKHSKTDLTILKNIKDALEDRYSIYHSAITFSQAFASCGTANDAFLRDNLAFLSRASNWAKFSITASLGLIHKGSIIRGRRLVKPYLPGGAVPSKFSEGGALYALGLIYAGRQDGAEEELRSGLAEGMDPVVQHGAALGYGISAVASLNDEIYEQLRTVLFQDNATSGEGAGYAMGLVMLGSKSDKALEEMLSYARETQHEKIIRSLAIGVAFVMYEQGAGADHVIDEMVSDQNAIIRYGGMFTIALAYAGTGSNKVVKRLLHVAVSDVNDDVRRAAVTALGFVLFRNHTQVPRVVQLLAESYNPHVRHGAALALGISCAGTGLEAAVELLEPMTRDRVDFVRQGAFIALAFVLIQQSEAQSPRSTAIREMFAKVVADKHEDPVARFGATIAQGIIDAGGRNSTLSLATRAGTLNMQAIVGVALFVQFWYWYPLAHGLGMAFSPTAVIAIDDELSLPEVEFTCHAKPSVFAYTSKAKKAAEKKEKKAQTAVLSTTAKANARQKKKAAEDGEEGMDMDTKPEDAASPKPTTSTTAASKRQKPTEPNQFTVKNMARVTYTQFPFLSFNENDHFTPVRPIGESLVKDKKTSPFNCGSVVVLKGKQTSATSTNEMRFILLDDALWNGPPEAAPAAAVAPAPAAAPAAVVEDVERVEEAPESFEYPFDD